MENKLQLVDFNAVIDTLKYVFTKGDVFEIRVLDASYNSFTWQKRKPHVESGFFDYDHIQEAAAALAAFDSFKGAYVTMNPISHDLLARRANRFSCASRESGVASSASDGDVISRRWLLIDCDAVRISGVSSNDFEHECALKKAIEIKDGMARMGWPAPMFIDSGNGAQLMYRIDIGAKEDSLIRDCLNALQSCNDVNVKIDTTVYNASRIWRIPGTMNCKGDSIESRPWRMSRVISRPANTEDSVVGIDRLSVLASMAKKVEKQINESPKIFIENDFDIDGWMKEHCPDAREPVEYNGGRKWLFDVCPFNPEHNDRSAVVIELPNGAISFRCHHNHCSGNDWHALRDLKEPGWKDRPHGEIYSDVDISAIAKPWVNFYSDSIEEADIQYVTDDDTIRMMEDESSIKNEAPWRLVTSDDVKKVLEGTLLGKLTDIYASVSEPPLPIEAALSKSLTSIGCCMCGEASEDELNERFGGNMGSTVLSGIMRSKLIINTAGGQSCNFYSMLIANSASGKDIGGLIKHFGNLPNPDCKNEGDYMVATSGTKEGLADELIEKPNGMILLSEMRNWLDKNCLEFQSMNFLTEVWDSCSFKIALSKRKGLSSREAKYCSPNVCGNIQPEVIERIATKELIETGAFGRWLIFPMPEFYGVPSNFDIMGKIKGMYEIAQAFQKKRGIVDVQKGYSDDLHELFAGNTAKALNATWSRLINMYYPRFAAILSLSENDIKDTTEEICISQETWGKARTLTMWFVKNAEQVLMKIHDESEFIKEREKIIESVYNKISFLYLKNNKHRAIMRSAISVSGLLIDGVRTTAKQRNEAIEELIDRRLLKKVGKGFIPRPRKWEFAKKQS